MPEDAPYYMDITLHPLANATLADVQDYPWPKGDDPSRFAGLRERALTLKQETPYAVVSGISGVVYEICWYLRGLEQWFCDLMGEPEFCEAMLDQTLKFWMDWFRLFLDEVGRRGGRDHDRRRPGRPERAAVQPGHLPPHRQAAPQAAGAIHPLPHPGQDLVSHLRRLHWTSSPN